MKTSIRIITLFVVFTFIVSNLVLAQDRASGISESVPSTPQTRTTARTSSTSPPSAVSDRLQQTFQDRAGQIYQESRAEADQQRQLFDSLAELSLPSSIGRTGAGSDNVLVIPTGEIEVEELLTINEDMNVMSRIFANGLGRQRTATTNLGWSFTDSRWVPTYYDSYDSILGRSTGNTISSMYLQGYGALFLMKVDFPFSGPSETKPQQEETEKEDVDEVWEQTKQQIYQPRVRTTTSSRRVAERPEVEYDAQRVENLKTTLIQSLKHAANIRALKQDESVIIRIAGSGRSSSIISVENQETQIIVRMNENGRNPAIIAVKPEDYQDFIKSFSTPEVLVIRAKKSDIDAFAKGELDFDQFREKVQILSYPLLGGSAAVAPISRTRTTGTSIVTR